MGGLYTQAQENRHSCNEPLRPLGSSINCELDRCAASLANHQPGSADNLGSYLLQAFVTNICTLDQEHHVTGDIFGMATRPLNGT